MLPVDQNEASSYAGWVESESQVISIFLRVSQHPARDVSDGGAVEICSACHEMKAQKERPVGIRGRCGSKILVPRL
jgi:hypothetical protein